MQQTKWFDRKFDFSHGENIFPSIMERLQGTPIRLRHKISEISKENLTFKPSGKWSIKENIGHLTDLEPLWQGRLEDILNGKELLRVADLENKKTEGANHNAKEISELLDEFSNARNFTLDRLSRLKRADIYKYALHPRLKTRMRTMDLFLFVAEHDDHHLAMMSQINRQLISK